MFSARPFLSTCLLYHAQESTANLVVWNCFPSFDAKNRSIAPSTNRLCNLLWTVQHKIPGAYNPHCTGFKVSPTCTRPVTPFKKASKPTRPSPTQHPRRPEHPETTANLELGGPRRRDATWATSLQISYQDARSLMFFTLQPQKLCFRASRLSLSYQLRSRVGA